MTEHLEVDGRTITLIDGCFVRKGRKFHRCAACRQDIGTGIRQVEYVGESSPYHSGPRYHIRLDCLVGLIVSDYS